MIDLLRQHIQNLNNTSKEIDFNISLLSPYLADGVTHIPESIIDLILFVPDMAQELIDVMVNESTSQRAKALSSGIYSYIFSPIDYIPEPSNYIYGFWDDALVAYYGLELVESIDQHIEFNTLRNDQIRNAILESEKLLSESVLTGIKSYPGTVNKSIIIR